LVLLEESNLHKVADPSAGSGGIEHLTQALCDAAWPLFQTYDKAGGAWASLERGLVQRDVAATREKRERDAARRVQPVTGVSDYPNLQEDAARVLDVPRVPAPKEAGAEPSIEPLPSIRLAAPYEAMRDAADAILAKTGARPKVFLANLGKLPDFNARAMFAKNFYEAGGIEAVTNDGFGSLDDMVSAFKASGAKLACLCSSDKVYETQAAEAAVALKGAGAIVHLAGRPGEHEAAWNKAGVSTYIYVGCDVLSTLRAAHDTVAKP
jgi:methylmalonyl-CoA mutase